MSRYANFLYAKDGYRINAPFYRVNGERVAIMEMRKHAVWYVRGLKGNGRVCSLINHIETRDGLLDLLYTYAHELEATMSAS